MQVGEFKSPSGLIRAEVEIQDEKIKNIKFTGDFFVYPEKRLQELEKYLRGSKTDLDELIEKIETFYTSKDIKTPSLDPNHWAKAINKALEGSDE